MSRLYVTSAVERKINRGVQCLEAKDFQKLKQTDKEVLLYNKAQQLLGTAYLSKQNKGIGWFLTKEKVTLNKAYFTALFQKAREKRSQYEKSDQTTAYRIFNQDGDFFGGMTIDLYGDYALFSWYNTFVYSIRQTVIAAFRDVFGDKVKGAYEKNRFKDSPYDSAFIYGQKAAETFLIAENGLKYSVFLNQGLMTGIFLDQRDVRKELANGLAAGKRLLNLFSYTAAFSLAAAAGGAAETVSVDLAKRSQELSLAHFAANDLAADNHRFLVMDVFDYLRYAKRKGLFFDIILIDPPSFARNKKQTFSVHKDYPELIAQAVDVLSENGLIIAAVNAANMSISQFKKELEKGLRTHKHTYLNLKQLPNDFTVNQADEKSNYLKVFTIKVEK
ncbi:class I SAM-dependent rRNA methyltransferase [Streptococcus chenjunshii]|uniref:Class I SAM-dependent rRNA methyltransferase n=1 Tax=Streptococcus chenjunshii TaxID=2173853 RepID=A0A372KKW7_9STRE|nr:class I SAM-dependent rRNA methyltransferase [Streptococcus chenjunshii]AXQ78892.1 class I SAM-dependent rRNA methyltransferase [Streptococcus chenjunshii]RFU50370.1 class I SAM-dependent rRNA methyltransferase [Streptococcus chenjunshii]RFU52574.1 class I SAM-dependent rRNA methyltransferase [Streptococcus chenjunshii]